MAPSAAASHADSLAVFVSYARRDLAFTEQLVQALEALGHVVVIDRRGIHGAERWEERLGQMIREADTVVFVLSPVSVASTVCRWELERALEAHKRILPVLAEPLDAAALTHQALRDLNQIHFYAEPAFPGSGWGSGLARLHAALSVDLHWIREHTRVADLAARWAVAAEAEDLLARGSELARLQAWRDASPANAPALTDAQRRFLQSSEAAQAARNDAARQQLEALATAQQARAAALAASEQAQQQRAKALRTMFRRTLAGAALALLLLVTAGLLAVDAHRKTLAIQEERLLQERLLMFARARALPKPPYDPPLLARRYEGQTPDHVGTDFLGSTYYGSLRLHALQQLPGFLRWLREQAPELAAPLDAAGGEAAAASRAAGFVQAWQSLGSAPASAARFGALQEAFVTQGSYAALVRRLRKDFGLDLRDHSPALRAVMYSIAVQHGPSSRFVGDAMASFGSPAGRSDRELIDHLYAQRGQIDKTFPTLDQHSPNFVALIQARYEQELHDAHEMLETDRP